MVNRNGVHCLSPCCFVHLLEKIGTNLLVCPDCNLEYRIIVKSDSIERVIK